MSQRSIVLLNELLHELGEDEVKFVLSEFMCPLNKDVEYFLKNTSIGFDKQGIAATHLVLKNYSNDFNSLISGEELLGMAIDTIKEAQRNIGGRFAYLECEDIVSLKDFTVRMGL